jgi:hypothetical protein
MLNIQITALPFSELHVCCRVIDKTCDDSNAALMK